DFRPLVGMPQRDGETMRNEDNPIAGHAVRSHVAHHGIACHDDAAETSPKEAIEELRLATTRRRPGVMLGPDEWRSGQHEPCDRNRGQRAPVEMDHMRSYV